MVRSDHGDGGGGPAASLSMSTSFLYLGLSPQAERAFRAQSACTLDELHWFAQRVCQYARASADHVQLRKLLPRIEKQVGSHFLGQLTLAVAERALQDEAAADAAWQRAVELTPPDHPWACVVPKAALWRGVPNSPVLVEEEHGRVYRLVGETKAPGAVFGTLGVGRFIRVACGALVFVNPVPIPDQIRPQVQALGDVQHIIAPAKYHSEHVLAAKRLFPHAKAWGVPAHRGFARVADIPFDGYLDDDAPLLPGEIDQITLHGNDVGDVWLLDRKSSTLITTDALFYAAANDEYVTAFGSYYAWAWGVCGRNGVPSYQPPMWRDLVRYQAALKRAFAFEFEHVAYCHGAWRAIGERGSQRLQETLGWILELGKWDGLRLTLDFVRRHPRIVYRALKKGGA
jgi:hypothetical protein